MKSDRHWDTAFDQADIEVLSYAFGTACRLAGTDRDLGRLDQTDAQKLIARRIMAVAGSGERNPMLLVDEAIADLRRRERFWRSASSATEADRMSGSATQGLTT